MKKRNVFLKRIIALISLSIIFSSVLSTVLYFTAARDYVAKSKSDELLPRARHLASSVAQYQNGGMSIPDFWRVLGSNSTPWDAQVIIFNSNLDVIAFTESTDDKKTPFPASELNEAPAALISFIDQVFNNKEVQYLPSFGSKDALQYIIIAVPAIVNKQVTGCVMLIKPMNEIDSALTGMTWRLGWAMLAVFAIMLTPAFIISRRMVKPLDRMKDAALSMAEGDFSIIANENHAGEFGQLARSLNKLSANLSNTISELRLEHSRLSLILDGLSDGILAIATNGGITHVNPMLMRFAGLEATDAPLTRTSLFADAGLWDAFEAVTASGDLNVYSFKADSRTLKAIITPLRGDSGGIVGAVGVFHDETESARLEQTRRDYVANVSHELRTPVASMRSLAEVLKDGMVRDEDSRQRYYGYILVECMRLSRLINDLLELSRLQSGTEAFAKDEILLDELFDDIQWRFQQQMDDMGLLFELGSDASNQKVYTNMDRIEQVLVILIDNAIKFTQSEGKITVHARDAGERIEISVEDNGCGIEPEDLPYVFDRFYKADKAHSGGGTGLGLSIAKEIIEKLGEKIWVKSELSAGTVFTLTLSKC